MRVIKVFPDYCSSGLWGEDGCNLWADSFADVVGVVELTLLRYWHEAWEFLLMDGQMEDPPVQRMSNHYVLRWDGDGKELVARWNAMQNIYNFIYEGDYWK